MKGTSLLLLLQKTVETLKSNGVSFALAGGIVASIYRDQARFTEDIDLLFVSDSAEKDATKILKQLGYEVTLVKLHQLKRLPMMNKKRAPALIAVGRSTAQMYGVDFVLPSMPWVEKALQRAQHNALDFGFGPIPCITVEDMILAKAFAGRRKDDDDLISIFSAEPVFDLIYIAAEMTRLKFSFSKEVLEFAPKALKKVLAKKR